MKFAGIVILTAGLVFAIFSLFMDTTVAVAARDYGYGVSSPDMRISNIDLISKRQSYLIFSGILSVVGAILVGFSSISKAAQREESLPSPVVEASNSIPSGATSVSVSICPKCRYMGAGDAPSCNRCGETFPV